MSKKEEKFSVLMSIYYKEKPLFFDMALKSILIDQTVLPSEVVLIKDGPLGKELEEVLSKYLKKFPNKFNVVVFEKNKGLGEALRTGVETCKNDIIFRMDTDDIAVPTRFEQQFNYMKEHPEIDVLGGNIIEFNNSIDEENTRTKVMPKTYEEIKKYAKMRNPINHMTVCFRKQSVLSVGNYQHMLLLEDYYLWCRMIIAGKKIHNLDSVLVYARIGNGFIDRRSSKKQLIGWKELQKYLYSKKFITFFEKARNLIVMYVLIYSPKKLLSFLYKRVFRK